MPQSNYDIKTVLRAIVYLAKKNNGIVANHWIFLEVTPNIKNYSAKQWNLLKPALIEITKSTEYTVDEEKYIISHYAPMERSRYNFYADEDKGLFDRRVPVAGFMVTRPENVKGLV